mmetsp:Transcript_15081/g.35775  ORF Transcript_15081/g.35775 Transcript_15081/m.35775 type:complete len:225 (+) Transcript_15081:828-1502(+)
MLMRDWISAPSSTTTSASFMTASLSPVRIAWSSRSVVDSSCSSRRSAGTRQPTLRRTTSPGTSSTARIVRNGWPSRRTSASSGSYCLSASIACSALVSCQTPTPALSTRMTTMTSGSTMACIRFAPSSSERASRKEMDAAPSSTLTSRSSNWASTSFQSGVDGGSGIELGPWTARRCAASDELSPHSASTLNCSAACCGVRALAGVVRSCSCIDSRLAAACHHY